MCTRRSVEPFVRHAGATGVPWEASWDRMGIHTSDPEIDRMIPARYAYRFIHDLSYRHGLDSLGTSVGTPADGGLGLAPRLHMELMGARSLLDALVAAREWIHLQSSGGWIGLRLTPRELLICHHGTVGIEMPGVGEVELFRTLRIIDLIRRYMGAAWQPARLSLMQNGPVDERFAERAGASSVAIGRPFGVVAIDRSELHDGMFLPESPGSGEDATDQAGADPVAWVRTLEAVLPTEVDLGSTSVDTAAEMLGCSARTLQRRLREQGTSYRQVLLRARLREARRLLAATDVPVHVVAGRVGYSDASNFGRAFRRFWSLAPGEVRELEQHSG